MSSLPGHAPLLVLVSGYPGAGKSTMAERIAATCSATVASFDWLMSAIRADADTWAIAEAPVERQRSIGWSLLARVAEQQLRIGGKCVVDVVAHETYRRELAALAARYGAQFVVVECVCSDEAVHEQRVTGRKRGIPEWEELDWSNVRRSRARYVPLDRPKLVVDAVDPIEVNFELFRQHLSR